MELFVLALLAIVGVAIVYSLFFDRVTVDDPHVALLTTLGRISDKLLTPGPLYHVWEWGGKLPIQRLIYLPGDEIPFNIQVDKAVTKDNVRVTVDLFIQVRIIRPYDIKAKKAKRELNSSSLDPRDMYPAYQAAKNFATWLRVNQGESLMSMVTPDNQRVIGILEKVLTADCQNAVTRVILRKNVNELDDEVLLSVFQEIATAVSHDIGNWGIIVRRWSRGKLVYTGLKIEHFEAPDEVKRTRVERNAKTEGQKLLTLADAHRTNLQRLRDDMGEEYAMVEHIGQALAKSGGKTNLNLFNGIQGLWSLLSKFKED